VRVFLDPVSLFSAERFANCCADIDCRREVAELACVHGTLRCRVVCSQWRTSRRDLAVAVADVAERQPDAAVPSANDASVRAKRKSSRARRSVANVEPSTGSGSSYAAAARHLLSLRSHCVHERNRRRLRSREKMLSQSACCVRE